ncbi:hypothetical protein [Nostoc sp. PCC 9305]|uniref:hypothetical protein n=1 Tax=Nostoc sp. PCC 9305 TaxID=296636 RepID=UPI0039C67C1A
MPLAQPLVEKALRCANVIKFCNRDLERVGESVGASDKSIDAAGWIGFQPTRQRLSMAFFYNLSHGCNPRSNIKNNRKAIAYPHGLERN